MKKKILIICRNSLNKAPRFLMEVNALKNEYTILAAGYNGGDNGNYKFISLKHPLQKSTANLNFHNHYPFLIRKIISFFIKFIYYKQLNQEAFQAKEEYKMLSKLNFDILIVHHLMELPVAVRLAKLKRVKLIFNAHEYYPLEFDDDPYWMQTTHIMCINIANTYLKYVNICFCVGAKIAEKYQKEFNLKSVVVTNSKQYYNLTPTVLKFDEEIKLVHHGAAIRSRKIELMIQMMSYLTSNYSLDLILVPGDEIYIMELKQLIKKYSNIRLISSVNTEEISNYINKYDIGLYLLPPTNFNNKYALPNKLFEFIQARLAIAISPSKEMAHIVNKYDLGIVGDDFTPKNLAEKIKKLTIDDIMHYKNNVNRHAKELSSENTEALIRQTVNNFLN